MENIFKDDFKKANDSIHADDELLNKVLSLKPGNKRFNPYKYIPAAAAAVFVLSTTAVILPKLMNHNDSGVIYESSVQYETPESNYGNTHSGVASENSKPEKSPSVSSAPEPTLPASTPAASPKPSGLPAKQTSAPKQAPAAVKAPSATAEPVPETAADNEQIPVTNEVVIHIPEESSLPEYSITADKSENDEDISRNIKLLPPETKKSVVLSINYSGYEPEIAEFNSAAYDCEDIFNEYSAEDWDNNRYFEYLGFDLYEHLNLPEDFSCIADEKITVMADKDGIPSFDNRIFPFDGNEGRYVTVMTSKNTMTARVYLSDEHYTLSSIYDIPAVIIGTEKGYRCYMICGSVSYVITADGLDEKELENMLVSLTAAK